MIKCTKHKTKSTRSLVSLLQCNQLLMWKYPRLPPLWECLTRCLQRICCCCKAFLGLFCSSASWHMNTSSGQKNWWHSITLYVLLLQVTIAIRKMLLIPLYIPVFWGGLVDWLFFPVIWYKHLAFPLISSTPPT